MATIVLLQTTNAVTSRTYLDFPRVELAIDAITKMYEERLQLISPGSKNLTYDVQDLFRWMDSLFDISCLVLDTKSGKFDPYPRDYLKKAIYDHLAKQAQGGGKQGGRR